MKKQKTQTKYGSVGGQALMEGIMMNGPEGKAMALRMPDGSISVEKKTFTSIKDKNKFFALPMIRGIVNFVEALIFGYKCLRRKDDECHRRDINGARLRACVCVVCVDAVVPV